METRASHLIVGLFVLVGSLVLAAFGLWLAKTDVDRTFDEYDVIFTGSVNGLQEGSQVQFRGVPVGRVRSIAIDEADIAQIIATIEVAAGTPVKTDTRATLALQGITGLANIQLIGGLQDSPELRPAEGQRRGRIPTLPSAIERVFESTPELLARAVEIMAQLDLLLSDDNIDAVGSVIGELQGLLTQLNAQAAAIEPLRISVQAAADAITGTAGQATATLQTTRQALVDAEENFAALTEATQGTLANASQAALAVRNLSYDIDRTFSNLERPLDDFSQSGLYDFTEMVREVRQLVATLSRISKELERDPAGFLIGGNNRGFSAE